MAERSKSKSAKKKCYALLASQQYFLYPWKFPGLILTENTDSLKRALGGKKTQD
jgi:hypothetical protein